MKHIKAIKYISLETILEKYNKTKEEIEEYNDLNEMKLGDKIIIPT